MASSKLTDNERDQILGLLRDGNSVREISRLTGRGLGTISGIAKKAGYESPRHEQTASATEHRQADLKAGRAELAHQLVGEARELISQMHRPHEYLGFSAGKALTRTLSTPTPSDKRNLMTSAAIALDKSMALERFDSDDQGLAAVDAWLRGVVGGKN